LVRMNCEKSLRLPLQNARICPMKKVTHIFSFLHKRIVEIPFRESDKSWSVNDIVFVEFETFGKNVAKVKAIGVMPSTKRLEDAKILKEEITAKDVEMLQKRKDEAKENFQTLKEKIEKYRLKMAPVCGAVSFDGSFFVGSFVAEERPDFREMVREFSKAIGRKVFFDKIGRRERGRTLGTLGKCGEALCCRRFLHFPAAVAMNAARVQNLRLQKMENLSGVCGKLKCCLNFEKELYQESAKGLPKMHRKVFHQGQEGKVIGLDILNKNVTVFFPESCEHKILHADEISTKKK